MGDSFAACATSLTAREQTASLTITFTGATRPAESATGLCHTRKRSLGTRQDTWAFGVNGAIRRLHQKLYSIDTICLQNAERNNLVGCLNTHYCIIYVGS
jgi:hypothetical protein